MAITILPRERWDELKQIFDSEFDSALPHANSTIIADVDELGRIKGFIVAETLIRVGQIYNSADKTREMFERLIESMPEDTGVIVIADQRRYERLALIFGMRHVPGKIYRRDF
jgi:hypothetical protein